MEAGALVKLRRLIAAPFEIAVLTAVVIWLALQERRKPRPRPGASPEAAYLDWLEEQFAPERPPAPFPQERGWL
jgi:hypothetical protein